MSPAVDSVPARAALAAALAEKETVLQAQAEAESARVRGMKVLEEAARKFATAERAATAADKAAAGTLAARLRANLGTGPSLTTSDEQMASRSAKAEAEAQRDNAKAVYDLLVEEAQAAADRVSEATAAIEAAVMAIAREEGLALAKELSDARARAREIEATLHGLGYFAAPGPTTLLQAALGGSAYLHPDARSVLLKQAPPLLMTSPEVLSEKGRWAAYLTALRANPVAMRLEHELPPPPAPPVADRAHALSMLPDHVLRTLPEEAQELAQSGRASMR